MNKKLWAMGVIGVLILLVAISGCTNSSQNLTSQNRTFSDGSVSFYYPADMINYTSNIGLVNGWVNVVSLINNNTKIDFSKNPNSTNPRRARDAVSAAVKQNSGRVLSSTDETNPNGVAVFRITTDLYDPNAKTMVRDYQMIFKGNGILYGFDIYGINITDSQIHETSDRVFNSIKSN